MTRLGGLTARHLRPLLDAATDPLTVVLWDGTRIDAGGPGPAPARVTITSPRVLWRLVTRPPALALGEAFVSGELDVAGDLFAAMRALHIASGAPGARQRSRRRAGRRDRAADGIGFHYDVSNEFYALFLDARMVYTCAYYPRPDATLDEAQEAKLDLVCRKLQLARGERFLDLGCGWGALVMWAAAHYGVRARGVTLSRAQAAWAAEAIARAGLGDRARVEYRDWRTLAADHAWDAVAAVGLIEHVGRGAYGDFFAHVARLLAPGGRFLNHGITNRPDSGWSDEMEFLARHVFPGGELAPAGETQRMLETSGFEVTDVENLRAHYARTTRAWAERLRAAEAHACALVGVRRYRTWLAYLTAASTAFEAGWIALHQIVATPIADAARWTTPRTRLTIASTGARETPARPPTRARSLRATDGDDAPADRPGSAAT